MTAAFLAKLPVALPSRPRMPVRCPPRCAGSGHMETLGAEVWRAGTEVPVLLWTDNVRAGMPFTVAICADRPARGRSHTESVAVGRTLSLDWTVIR